MDSNWNSKSLEIKTDGRPERKVMSLVGQPLDDQATWVAYNLPLGLVVTLVETVPTDDVILPAHCGRTVDLVGTGKVETCDLGGVNLNDCVSGWYRRPVDLLQGGVVLYENYENQKFSGQRPFLFISDWQEATVHGFDGWWLQDQPSGVKWVLSQGQYVTLYEHPDGTGRTCYEISGSSGDSEAILGLSGFDGLASAFSWTGIKPVRQEIHEANVTVVRAGSVQTISSTATCRNETSSAQTFEVAIGLSSVRELTVEDVDTHGAGGSVEMSASYTAGTNVALASTEATMSISVSAHYDYEKTTSKSELSSQEESTNVSQTITAPPMTQTAATLEVNLGRVSETVHSVDVTRWYSLQVPGSTLDDSSKLWKRVEQTTIRLNGGVQLGNALTVKETKI